ncbi:helix-turn-helix domain-containing protein [Metabacillus halosaccharovorans]|uniref:helix-turn-helix domain-containing protein n=1 Tax=Metabacillus halosaccharovorans TaxID=930124 RepID=UPI0034CFD0C5
MIRIKSDLKRILDERNLSIRQVSRDIEYRFDSVRQLYNDESKTFSKELIGKLCTYLNVTPGDIIVIEKEPTE